MIKNNINSDSWDEIQEQFKKIQEESGIEPDEDYEKELEGIFGISFNDMNEEMDMMYKTKTIAIQRIHPEAVLPSYAYPSDSGFDLYSVEEIIISPFGRALVPTGLKVGFDEGFEIQVRPKSGLAINQGLTVLNTPGTVDSGYNGEIKVIIFNTNNVTVTIPKRMKIGQAVLCPVVNGKYVKFEEVDNISEKDRGNNGFGSTGIL
jgi:dUTP pyrophosphatase